MSGALAAAQTWLELPRPSMLDMRGAPAEIWGELWWLFFYLMSVIFLIVIGMLGYALLRRRGPPGEPEPMSRRGELRLVIWAGAAIPLVVLIALNAVSAMTGSRLVPGPEAALRIEVIGHQFWWEVRYPDHDVLTANEIHLPAGVPVRVDVTSPDVIHSFWVPQLAGKIDMIPGRVNTTWIEAREPGVYRGQCAEFCGLQHALMAFLVIAQPPGEFERWLADQRRPFTPPPEGAAQRGMRVFVDRECADCHAVRGFSRPSATGQVGPDLTHFGSRRTIGAATVPNTRANLGGWVLDPHSIKPGNRMPPTRMEVVELFALLDFLESLR